MAKILIGNIKGPKGDTGEQGPQGATGPQGPQGPLPPLVNNALATEAGVAALDAVMGKTLQDQITGNDNDITQLKNDLTSKRFQKLDDYKNTSVVSEISNCWIHTVGGLAIVDFGIFLVSQHFGESDLVVFNVPDVFKPSLVFYGTLSSTDGKFSTRCSIETSGEIKISISPDSEKYLGGQIIYLLE